MKKILVPTDFSGVSRNAEDYAVSLAKSFNAEVHLLHVFREVASTIASDETWAITTTELKVENEKLINYEVRYLEARHGIKVNADVENGSKSKTICVFANEIKADLIVMGMRSRRKKVLGSAVVNTVRKSKIPVLIVPEKEKFNLPVHLLLAVDYKEIQDSACFDLLYEIYKRFNSSLQVLHVNDRAGDLTASDISSKKHLGHVLTRFNYQYDWTESYDVDEGIKNYIENHPADLLVLIAHHHTLFERLFETIHTKSLGSIIEKPILVLKHS